ncbi:M48 family metallopeptidase [Bdellovibrio bacteriovorus]|uniref:Peptidase M48 n=1 Tax=Bdellovibrio bacteriovorus TaxID=959 RepID=A0A150WW43_BDEBC|nr:M48 family metallopeptidase [Bdellovibrio bacteriovorus]KYG70674.1 peptidase M48 [Bdellovibrio bacteriovorus]
MRILAIFPMMFFIASCATSTNEGEIGVSRKQLLLPVGQINDMAAQTYNQMKADAQKKGALDKNPKQVERVQAIAKKLIPQTSVYRSDALKWDWEVHVITSDEINAFCMPGGKIMFYSAIIDKLQLTDAEIAAIMGHEIAHALREHSRERMSQELIKSGLAQVILATGKVDPSYIGYADQAVTLGILLPYGRGQETEADDMGLELMARAGYNPQEAVNLWKKMAAQGGGKPPEILSTHPADETRIKKITALLPKVMPLYEQVKKN